MLTDAPRRTTRREAVRRAQDRPACGLRFSLTWNSNCAARTSRTACASVFSVRRHLALSVATFLGRDSACERRCGEDPPVSDDQVVPDRGCAIARLRDYAVALLRRMTVAAAPTTSESDTDVTSPERRSSRVPLQPGHGTPRSGGRRLGRRCLADAEHAVGQQQREHGEVRCSRMRGIDRLQRTAASEVLFKYGRRPRTRARMLGTDVGVIHPCRSAAWQLRASRCIPPRGGLE